MLAKLGGGGLGIKQDHKQAKTLPAAVLIASKLMKYISLRCQFLVTRKLTPAWLTCHCAGVLKSPIVGVDPLGAVVWSRTAAADIWCCLHLDTNLTLVHLLLRTDCQSAVQSKLHTLLRQLQDRGDAGHSLLARSSRRKSSLFLYPCGLGMGLAVQL